MRLDGRGRLRVRSICSSYGHSWYWLNADAPEASRKMPATGISEESVRLAGLSTRAAKPVKVTARETGNRVSVRSTRKMEVCKVSVIYRGCDDTLPI
jgi:hypothetical protein